jgi:2,4-dienoyl-CoA reductase (NADPH2)
MNGNDFMPGGNGRADLQAFAQALVAAGTDALNVNVGWHEARVPQIVTAVPRGVYAYLARGIRELVDVPVAAGHRINDPRTAREMIAEGMCDFVAMGRALIADPFLPAKAAEGREARSCIASPVPRAVSTTFSSSNRSNASATPGPAAKARRPRQGPDPPEGDGGGRRGRGHERRARGLGGGPCGRPLRKGGRLGGQLHLAGAPPGRGEFVELARDLQQQVAQSGVAVVLNRPVDPALIEAEKPDVVILATGAVPVRPPLPGADLPHVVQAWDVLRDRAATGRQVVVVGGGAVGVETALFLAEKGPSPVKPSSSCW